MKFTSEEFPKRKSHDNNHLKLHPSQFNFLCDILSSRTPTWSRGTFSLYALVSLRTRLPTHSSLYTLVSLRICLPMHLSYRYVRIPAGRTFCLDIFLRSSTCQDHPWLSQYATRKLSYQLDAIDASPLCDSQPCHQSTRVTGWITSGHRQYIISLMTKAYLQYANKYSGKLAWWQRSDGYPPSVCH